MERKQKGKVNMAKKILGFIPGLLYNILVIFCVILIAIIVMQRLSDSNRSVKGYKIFKVVSGSMVPKYDVGEVVICKETPVTDIEIGDAIVYRGKIGDLNGRIVMHEVVEIHQDKNNQLKFYAKGLNNSKGDPEISESQIMGVVIWKSGILTLLYRLATSIYSAFIIITILVINVFVSFKSGKPEEDDEEENEENEEEDSNQVLEKNVNNLQNNISSEEKQIEQVKTQENISEINIEKNEGKKLQKELESPKAVEKKETVPKVVSSKEKEEEIVIDSKQEFDKIENVEKSTKKTTKDSASKTATKKTTSSTAKKTKKNETKTEGLEKKKAKKNKEMQK